MNRLAYRIVATKRKRDIGYATADFCVRQIFANPFRGVDEIHAVIGMLFNAGGNGKNIRIKNNIFRREADFIDQNFVRTRADFNLALVSIGLTFFVEGHDNNGRPITATQLGALDEFRNTLLHRNRIHNRLALHTFQARFNDAPF